MPTPVDYDRDKAVQYALDWAYGRNPQYGDFSNMGGDCTNFISQCLIAGGDVQNYTKDTGWYYRSMSDRAAAWTAARYLYTFLTGNRGAGPVAQEVAKQELAVGDIIQLENETGVYHSLFVCGFAGKEPLVSTHTMDARLIPLSRYSAPKQHFMHIVRFQK